jgi:hypothetical protein
LILRFSEAACSFLYFLFLSETMLEKIVVRGARQHNLKNISLEIQRPNFH